MLQVRKFNLNLFIIVKCVPLSKKLSLPTISKFEFIYTDHFPAKLQGSLHCIKLNYEPWLCYYRDAICCYEQRGTRFSKKIQFLKLQVCIRLSFGLNSIVSRIAHVMSTEYFNYFR